jgi:hypothetical protein
MSKETYTAWDSAEFLEDDAARIKYLKAALEENDPEFFVKAVGLEALRAPHVKHLDGKLWELRVRAVGGRARGIYVTATGRRVVVLHVFAKKSRKTPPQALATARERMQQVRL